MYQLMAYHEGRSTWHIQDILLLYTFFYSGRVSTSWMAFTVDETYP